MRLGLLAYCLGLMLTTFATDLDQLQLLLAVFFPSCALAILILRHLPASPVSSLIKPSLILSLWFCTGIAWHCHWAESILQQRLPFELEGVEMLVKGVVLDMPSRNTRAQQFSFWVLESDHGFAKRKILLNYYGKGPSGYDKSTSGADGGDAIIPGQHYQFLLRLNRPHGFANPAGFDYEAWLFQRGISAKGYVLASDLNRVLDTRSISVNRLRFHLREKLAESLSGLSNGGPLLALSLGETSELTPEQWQLFSSTGTNHLFVISGLHIGLIASICYWLGNKFLRHFPALILRMPAQKLASALAILAAFVYSLLAGFALPTQRAFVMVALFMLGYISNRPGLVSLRFIIAVAAVLSLNPLAGLNAGFWLSFVAVAGLCLCLQPQDPGRAAALPVDESLSGGRATVIRIFRQTLMPHYLKPQWAVFISLSLPLIYWTKQLSIVAPLINIIAIPVVGIIVVPLCLLALLLLTISTTMAGYLLLAANGILDSLFYAMARLVEHMPSWMMPTFPGLSLTAAWGLGIASLLLLLPMVASRRYLALVLLLLLPLVFPVANRSLTQGFRLHILDVGQGLAVIVETSQHTLVYDTGADFGGDFNLGSAVIAPVLQALGIDHLDRVVVSHGDNDHAGGLSGLLASIDVAEVVSSEPNLPSALPVSPCRESDSWVWDGVAFRFLHPDHSLYQGNQDSCVLQVTTGSTSVLLPGDIDVSVERRLALEYADSLHSSVLIAPHHGSNSSSSYALIKRTAPDYVVFATGYRNSFHHPTEKVVARYRQLGVIPINTSETGMVSFALLDGVDTAMPALYRAQKPRYWH